MSDNDNDIDKDSDTTSLSRAELETIVLDLAKLLIDGGTAIEDVLKDPSVTKLGEDIKKLIEDIKGGAR